MGFRPGHFQANGALPLSKRLGRPGPEVARQIVESARLDDVCQSVEVSGPGLSIWFWPTPFVAERLAEMAGDERLGVAVVARPERIVVDYSAPNVAKEMHVGHLRSTVIGDALRRMLEFVGHHVIAENHIGDWGTPFGMLIEHLVDLGQDGVEAFSVGDLNEFYRQARQTFDADETFRERSRRRVVLLQSGDPETMALWNALVAESIRHYDAVYEKLGVELTDDEIVGESFYNPMLAGVVEDLRALGLLVQDDGAQCVFPPVSPTARESRSRSSSRNPTRDTATPPPIWLPSATGSAACGRTACSMWWGPLRPSTWK